MADYNKHFVDGEESENYGEEIGSSSWKPPQDFNKNLPFFTRFWSKGSNRMIIYIWTTVLVLFNIITGIMYGNTDEVTDEDKKKKNTLKTTLIVVNVLLVCMLLGVFGFLSPFTP